MSDILLSTVFLATRFLSLALDILEHRGDGETAAPYRALFFKSCLMFHSSLTSITHAEHDGYHLFMT